VNHNIFAETINYFEQHEQIECEKNSNMLSDYFSYTEKFNFKSRLGKNILYYLYIDANVTFVCININSFESKPKVYSKKIIMLLISESILI